MCVTQLATHAELIHGMINDRSPQKHTLRKRRGRFEVVGIPRNASRGQTPKTLITMIYSNK